MELAVTLPLVILFATLAHVRDRVAGAFCNLHCNCRRMPLTVSASFTPRRLLSTPRGPQHSRAAKAVRIAGDADFRGERRDVLDPHVAAAGFDEVELLPVLED